MDRVQNVMTFLCYFA